MFAYSSRTETQFAPNLVCLFPETRKRFQNSEKLSQVRVPVRVVPVARKLSTTEERRRDQSCLLRRGDCITTGLKPKKLSWVCVPVRVVTAARKLNSIEERRRNQRPQPRQICPGFEPRWRWFLNWNYCRSKSVRAVLLTAASSLIQQCHSFLPIAALLQLTSLQLVNSLYVTEEGGVGGEADTTDMTTLYGVCFLFCILEGTTATWERSKVPSTVHKET
jgi:hypothetical protein